MEQEIEEYYTPEISELFLGWEGEVYQEYLNIKGMKSKWVPFVYGKDNAINWFIYNDKIKLRVPYLSKSALIEEGWILNEEDSNVWKLQFNTVDNRNAYLNYFMEYNYETKQMIIEEMGSDSLFNGYIKDLNSFRKLQTWLGIK